MGLKDLFVRKNPESKSYRRKMAAYLDRKRLKCVTVRSEDGTESVIGRGGDLLVREGEFVVFSEGKTLFRCGVTELDAWELMSLNGVVLSGPDREHDGLVRSVTAYYEYWRPVT